MSYMKNYRAERKKLLIELLGGKCANCDTTERLQFDHIDPKTKLFTIVGNLTLAWVRLVQEVKKCQLLCDSCHREKTKTERGFQGFRHGSLARYTIKQCRCSDCRAAVASYMRTYRLRKGAIA